MLTDEEADVNDARPEVIATEKYRADPTFRALVDDLARLVQHGYTGYDLALASVLAQMIAARERNP